MTWHRPLGSTARDGWDVVVEPDASGWEHTGLYAGRLADGGSRRLPAGCREHVVVPLSGSVVVSVEGAAGSHEAQLAGRSSVFAGPTDVAYVPAGSALTVTGVGDARVAVCFAVTDSAEARFPFRHVAANEVPIELRGAGIASREVRNFATPGVLDADSLIACEVVTPAGNWSSWPPHKHDEQRPGEETQLEEIYFFEVESTERSELDSTSEKEPAEGGPSRSAATERSELDSTSEKEPAEGGPSSSAASSSAATERSELDSTSEEQPAEGGPSSFAASSSAATERSELDSTSEKEPAEGGPSTSGGRTGGGASHGLGYVRVYGTEHRPIDVLAEVRSGDVVLVPHGWHGPAMAAPGYDLYYLNVMAGPGEERAWLISDDPAHGWVRDTWSDQPVDPRLPFGGPR